MRLFHKMFMIACLASAAAGLPGLAQADEPPPAVKAFLNNLERQSAIKPAYDSLTVGADGTVTISNLTLSEAAKGDQPGLHLGGQPATDKGLRPLLEQAYRDLAAYETDPGERARLIEQANATRRWSLL